MATILRRPRSRTLLANLLIVAALAIILGPLRYYLRVLPDAIDAQEYGAAILVDRLREAQRQQGLDLLEARLVGDEIEIVGPPDGSLYEIMEATVLRWKLGRPLQDGERFQLTVAYYPKAEPFVTPEFPPKPRIEVYVLRSEKFQLPKLDVDPGLPVVAWSVHSVTSDGVPTGSVSDTFRILHAYLRPLIGGYQYDSGL